MKIRINNHKLMIETGRYNQTSRNDRFCPICNSGIIDHSRKYHNILLIMLFVCHPKILQKHCLQFFSEVKMAPRETENNPYAKFWGDKESALWFVMVFSGVIN